LKNPSFVNGCQYGIVPLGIKPGTNEDVQEFLVFGGIEAKAPYDVIDRTCIFTTSFSDF
jgi:hypothetical protein